MIDRDEIIAHIAEILARTSESLAHEFRRPSIHVVERALVDAMCDAFEHHIDAAEKRSNQRIAELEARIDALETELGALEIEELGGE